MRPRRHEDYPIPSDHKLKVRDRGNEFRHDSYTMPGRDFSERSPRSRRSLSPRRVEGSRRLLGLDGWSSSMERRDYGWDSRGARGERVRSRSRSPPFGLLHKRSHYEEGLLGRELSTKEFRRRYDFVDAVVAKEDMNDGFNPEYRYQHGDAGLTRGKDFDDSRLLGSSRYGISGQKSMASEKDSIRDSFRLPKDLGPTSRYGEDHGSFSISSANPDMRRFKDERARYPDPLPLELSATESYRDRENPMFFSGDASYPELPMSESKDFIGTSQFKDFGGTSSVISRASFQGSYREAIPSSADAYPKNSAERKQPLGFSDYGHRSILDSRRQPNMEHKDMELYCRETFSPTRAERQDYLKPKRGGRDNVDYGYLSDGAYRRMSTHEQVEYDHKDLLRPGTRYSIRERGESMEYTYRNLGDRSIVDQCSMQKQTISDYLGAGVSTRSKRREDLDSGSAHVEFPRRASREHGIPLLDVSKDYELSRISLGYGFGRDAGPTSPGERLRFSPEFKYEAEVRELALRTHDIKEEFRSYDSSDRAYKRIYDTDVERHNSKNNMSDKWYYSSRTENRDGRSEELTGEDLSRSLDHGKKLYQRTERADHHRGSASEEWLSSHGYVENVREHSDKLYKPNGRYLKGRLRHGPSTHSSYRYDRKHVLPKPNNVWIRGKDDNQMDTHGNDIDQSVDWGSSGKSEPPEQSEEFKQLVNKAFLMFSKKLNDNPAVRKRYKEQGKAGSLFCIVCGRSASKEFMDTQRLVQHCFMSHKVGLRADHLGLHKAICVLLGWNTVVATDVVTCVPEAVSEAEAMAQKEDLIVWPPVVIIHNRSIAESSEDESKAIRVEAVGDFLRGKGFSGGTFKVCLGKPWNPSVIMVKFLGTFSGLGDAERLHKYFVENKHGRADFERAASSSRKGKSSSNGGVESKQERNLEEVLYGYLGISEDLDKVDTDTKRKCLIKSKKEIQDLANAPVKPE